MNDETLLQEILVELRAMREENRVNKFRYVRRSGGGADTASTLWRASGQNRGTTGNHLERISQPATATIQDPITTRPTL